MAVTCDRCSKPIPRRGGFPRIKVEHEGNLIEVAVVDPGEFCNGCLAEIVRNGTVVDDGAPK